MTRENHALLRRTNREEWLLLFSEFNCEAIARVFECSKTTILRKKREVLKMKHWKRYRGKVQAKNFPKQIASLDRAEFSHQAIADHLNDKYDRYGLNLNSHVVCNELVDQKNQSAKNPILSNSWNAKGLAGLSL